MCKIYIIEGADGTGKSTLAKFLANETKGHILHSSFNKDWDIEDYHETIMDAAVELSEWQDVIIDRWAVSEHVYGKVFRGGESYNTSKLIEDHNSDDIVWIYCRNDNAVQNHFKNQKERKEMFSSMEKVVIEFDEYVKKNIQQINWITYNFDKISIPQFIKEIMK